MITKLDSTQDDFIKRLDSLLAWESVSDAAINTSVLNIIDKVRTKGDEALVEFSQQFDRVSAKSMGELTINPDRLKQAFDNLPIAQQEALKTASTRIRAYHERQVLQSWRYTEPNGTMLGQQVTALDKVGLYVPGGKAAYPSSVLMNAIPAKVAGVPQVVMVVPTPDDEVNQLVLAAAYVSDVDCVYAVGGAQAVAALAYGTQTIPKVDKIVGPGNIYVATAKKHVFGQVGIDMIAGPSEILIICDGQTNPDWIAMDLFSQAEHDELAQAILISQDSKFLAEVEKSIAKLLPTMERKNIIATSLKNRGALIKVKDLDEGCIVGNRIAPEHLELSVADPESLLKQIRHAGSIFMGRYTSESLGDYCAGTNHVLPTSGTARFSSPLGVYDFQKRSSLIYCTQQGADELGITASILAHGESLTAHAKSAEFRLTK